MIQTWNALRTVCRRVESDVTKVLRAHELSIAEYETLHTLNTRATHAVRICELVSITRLSQSTVTRLVSGLEQRGLVTRRLSRSDRRGIVAELSELGQVTLNRVQPAWEEVVTAALGEIAGDPEFAHLVKRAG
ncbi:MarR family winged helix-turn-helix transcriptional regulator [Streptomyces sp. NPDC002018]|uniref:MarR family winged helix-turn-helix transcriptional regulator n=1 Tax=Streptomyces sp. NPDC002018 TaxID=3364629 RepID=UPI0036AA9AA6